jgi:hypothetical protein
MILIITMTGLRQLEVLFFHTLVSDLGLKLKQQHYRFKL